MKHIAILGSTGSIGTQTLDVISQCPDRMAVEVLVAGSNVDLLARQALKHRPRLVVIADTSRYAALSEALRDSGIAVAAGQEAINDAMTLSDIDTVVSATVGYSGLSPTLRAIQARKEIALANKETMVVAGDIVTDALRRYQTRLFPVDSEHSAIYQCLVGEDPASVSRLLITASGGPFLNYTPQQMASISVKDALNHPRWHMGAKITIDSATMMNKAFEIIEARWLFDIPGPKIVPVVHPQSVVHSMVEFCDGEIKAQLGIADMRLPIRYALGDATRIPLEGSRLALQDMASLTFMEPRWDLFPCLRLGHWALQRGGNTACVINAANEVAVDAFLHDSLPFNGIYPLIEKTLEKMPLIEHPSYHDYVETDAEARRVARSFIK